LAAMLLEGILPLDIVILSMTAGLAELVCGALLGRLIYADASSASKGEEVAT
jgi:hypothetical protein